MALQAGVDERREPPFHEIRQERHEVSTAFHSAPARRRTSHVARGTWHVARGTSHVARDTRQKSYPIHIENRGLRNQVLPPWNANTASSHSRLKSVRHDQSKWIGKPSANVSSPTP